jgi:2-C-methyl-D-erythritol 4-phosphate cytidylyltransferase
VNASPSRCNWNEWDTKSALRHSPTQLLDPRTRRFQALRFASELALRYTLRFATAASRHLAGAASRATHKMSRIVAILPAAGLGTRMGAETPKQFLELDGTPIVVHSVRRIASCPLVTDIIVATRPDVVDSLEQRLRGDSFMQSVRVIRGGDSRQDSVALALDEVPTDTELVLVHDAVRPFVTREQIVRVIEEARRCQAAILGIPAMDTVKEVKRASLPEDVALITATVPRERVVLAQTPQVFSTKLIKEAFVRAQADGVNASDEAGLVERLGRDVHVVLGSERNIKITKPADMDLARFYLERERQKP